VTWRWELSQETTALLGLGDGGLIVEVELGGVLLLLGAAFGIVYGLMWLFRRPSAPRTIFKTAPVALFAVGAYGLVAPPLLVAGLILSAAGDAFLAGEGRRRLTLGLGAFLLAHLAYIAVFVLAGADPHLFIAEPWRAAAILTATGVATILGRWLWPDLGALRWAVAAYIAAIVMMVTTAFLLAPVHTLAMPGAALFMASDAILSFGLFKPNTAWAQGRWAKRAVWFLYLSGQALITLALLPGG
jgi:uncharacterized membrane protein YhhN